VLLVLLVASVPPARADIAPPPATAEWQALGALAWTSATTGLRGADQRDLPMVDLGYDSGPIELGGRVFAQGLGLYPYAEVVYRLDDAYSLFEATLGARPREWVPGGGARVLVYGDGAVLLDSGPLAGDAAPRAVAVGIAGVRELRLVAVDVPGMPPAYTYLGEPRLLRVADPGQTLPAPRPLGLRGAGRLQERTAQTRTLEAQGQTRAAAVRAWLAERGGRDPVASGRLPDGALVLANQEVAVVIEVAGAEAGRLAVLDLAQDRLVATGLQPGVVLAESRTRGLGELTPLLAATALRDPSLPALGRGQTLRVSFATEPAAIAPRPGIAPRLPLTEPLPGSDLAVALEVSVFAGSRGVLLQLEADRPVRGFRLLDGDAGGGLVLGDDLRYVTDYSRPREGLARDDGLERPELVALGAPVFLWGRQPDAGLVLAALDETELPPRLGVRRDPGAALARVTLETGPSAPELRPDPRRSPRLYLEPTQSTDLRWALMPYRALAHALHPAPPLPSWVRHQWGSWYVYGMDVDERKIRDHIDYIATYLGDVGPWHVLLDAGWFVADGRPGAELERVDPDKFPSGIRALVDYAHARGVRLILYYSAPYVDTGPALSRWLALPGFVEKHRDWLIPLGTAGARQSYVYDFTNQGLRGYMRGVLSRYLREWNADGLLVDMVGHTQGALLNQAPPDRFGLVPPASRQSLEIYRFLWREAQRLRPDALIEGAWDTPQLARPYAHTWRYADDFKAFRSDYPIGGLVEHVDYAVLQYLLLGQRPHMGALTGQPDGRLHAWWLGAGLALGAQVVLSLPLADIAPADLADYRAYLTQTQLFAGDTYVGAGLHPDTFATTVRGTTFLGVLNRDPVQRDIPVDLSELGLSAGATYLAYDVELDRYLPVHGSFSASLWGESFRLFVLRREPGVLWTPSGYQARPGLGCLHLTLSGPAAVPGYLKALVPGLRAVSLDGRSLVEGAAGPDTYQYDPALGALTLQYAHGPARELRVDC
jgi:hypothetical protein